MSHFILFFFLSLQSWTDLVGVFEFEAGDDLTLQLAVLARLVQDGLAELWDVGSTSFSQHRVQSVVWGRRRNLLSQVRFRLTETFISADSSLTCVLRDLSLGDHLFTLGIHQLAVLVLFQTLKDVPGIRLGAEPLQERRV